MSRTDWVHKLSGRLGRMIRREGETEAERLQRISVPPRAMVLFLRQFVALMQGGVPLVQCLQTLSMQQEYPDFGQVVEEVTHLVSSGHTLSASLARFPQVFSNVSVVMVQVGEKSGSLDHSLDRLAGWLERDSDLVQRIRSALAYPAFILTATLLLTLGLFYGVMPSFVTIFEEMHVQLPWITRIVIAFTHAVRNPLVWAISGVVVWAVSKLLHQACWYVGFSGGAADAPYAISL